MAEMSSWVLAGYESIYYVFDFRIQQFLLPDQLLSISDPDLY